MLTIIDGALCCLWGLANCSTPTVDSGLRVRAKDLSNDASAVVEYGGQCYVVLPDVTTCGTLATGFTTVASCDACTPCTGLCQGRDCATGSLVTAYAPCPPMGTTATYYYSGTAPIGATGNCLTFNCNDPAPSGSTATPDLTQNSGCDCCDCPTTPATVTITAELWSGGVFQCDVSVTCSGGSCGGYTSCINNNGCADASVSYSYAECSWSVEFNFDIGPSYNGSRDLSVPFPDISGPGGFEFKNITVG